MVEFVINPIPSNPSDGFSKDMCKYLLFSAEMQSNNNINRRINTVQDQYTKYKFRSCKESCYN